MYVHAVDPAESFVTSSSLREGEREASWELRARLLCSGPARLTASSALLARLMWGCFPTRHTVPALGRPLQGSWRSTVLKVKEGVHDPALLLANDRMLVCQHLCASVYSLVKWDNIPHRDAVRIEIVTHESICKL